MLNNGLFSSLFIEKLKNVVKLDDAAQGRMATLAQTWRSRNFKDTDSLWETFLKQALSYLEFVPPGNPTAPGIYPLFEDWGFSDCIGVLYLVPPESDIDNVSVGSFYPAKLLAQLKERKLNWGILTNGAFWRLYSTKSSRPYEDYVELYLEQALEGSDESEYGLFERFFHKDSFIAEEVEDAEAGQQDESVGVYKCRLDRDREQSEQVLEENVKAPFLAQVDEVLQYLCNGFIFDTRKSGEEYTEEERAEIFESAVKLIYRSLFLFYAEARRLLPSDPDKADLYQRHSIQALCKEARKFRWGERRDTDQYDLWKHLKGLINAVNDGDSEYGIMGYNGGLFDDEEERFLGQHRLRNDFMCRALYLLAFVDPYNKEPNDEYAIPYEDLEVRHLGELYENILEYTVLLADADRIRRRTKKGVEILLASQTTKKQGDTLIKKGDVYFGESALERKQTGSYYTPEALVRFLNEKTIIQPLMGKFEQNYRKRFDELLEQSRKGHDMGTRRGAAQAASALVERFVQEKVLEFKVCDPAMGSGHFLVDAANQMAGLVVALLEEVPHVEGIQVSVSSRPNDWRRRITRHCIYGVDLNPLAVNLAKLSLWLNSFAIDHKLTFLDHHIRCGNSLIGIRSLDQLASIPERKKSRKIKNKPTGELFPDFKQYAQVMVEVGRDVLLINEMDEDDTEKQKAVFDRARGKTATLKPMADLYTSYLMDANISADDYHTLFYSIAKQCTYQNPLNPDLSKIPALVENYQIRHHFFHWPLEFPDIFQEKKSSANSLTAEFSRGFSATVGNPPWDVLKPNSKEFFLNYDPKFRSYKKQQANKVSQNLMADNPAIAEKWEEYCDGFTEQSTYFKEPVSYSALGKGDINTFKLFLEQFFTVLKDGGRMGIVVPSGLYTDQGCQPLRQLFFDRKRVDFLYCFENRRAIFNIHRSFKFVLFGSQKGGKTDRFKCAFMEHDPERLPLIDANAFKMSVKQVKKFSPDIISIMEFKSQRAIDTASEIYDRAPLIKDGHQLTVAREFDLTGDGKLLSSNDNGGPILYEGKMLWLFDCDFSEPRYWIKKDLYPVYYRKDSINRTSEFETLTRKKIRERVKNGSVDLAPERYRLGFREIAADTNERTFIASIIPPPSPHCYTIRTFETYHPKLKGRNIKIRDTYPAEVLLFWAGICNSFVFDFVARIKTTNHLSTTYMDLPLPGFDDSKLDWNIAYNSGRLICTDSRFADLWNVVFKNYHNLHDLLLPNSTQEKYGPAHEQEIRRRLQDEGRNLTSEWGPHCGVHDRLPDRRDTGDRAQLRAEIDAYVAHLYGLSRDDFAYILDTFPVLKKKEKKAFGEFMSKRKCLEEYDRICKLGITH